MAEDTNDNHDAVAERRSNRPDAHGQAAMLLVESLLHGLVARSVISVVDAVEIVGIAAEVKEEIAFEMGDDTATMRKSLDLLESIRVSLTNDLPGG